MRREGRRKTGGSGRGFSLAAVTLLSLIATGAVAATGLWLPKKVLQRPFGISSPPEAPVVAMNRVGHGVAVWWAMGAIRFAEVHQGGPWSASTAVVPQASGGPATTCLGSNQTTAVAWYVPGDRHNLPKLVASVRAPGGVFPSPVTVLADARGLGDMKCGVVDGPPGSPLAPADGGTTILVWNTGAGVATSSLQVDGGWSAPALLSSAGVGAALPDLAVNDAGEAVAVWQQNGMGNPSEIAAASRSLDGTWDAPVIVSGGSGRQTWNPKPAIGASGEAAVGYLDGSILMVVRKGAASAPWGPPEAVSGSGALYPALAMADGGDMIAAWQQATPSGTSIVARLFTAGGGWEAAQTVSGKSGDCDWPVAAFSPDGLVFAVTWNDNAAFKAKVVTGSPGGPWTRATLGPGYWGTLVPAAAGGGSVIAAWAAPGVAGNANTAKLFGRVFY
jgi:hypothetical protein